MAGGIIVGMIKGIDWFDRSVACVLNRSAHRISILPFLFSIPLLHPSSPYLSSIPLLHPSPLPAAAPAPPGSQPGSLGAREAQKAPFVPTTAF